MSTKSPRIQVSLPPDVYETIEIISHFRKMPKSRVLSEIIVEMSPGLSRLASILKEAQNASSEVVGGMVSALDMLASTVAPMEQELYRLLDSDEFKKAINPPICNTGVHSLRKGGKDV